MKKILPILFLFLSLSSTATHIVGGYLSYECRGLNQLGDVSYFIRMRLYRDCENGDPLARESFVPVTIFRPGGSILQVVNLQPIQRDTIPDDVSNPCVVQSPDICVEEEIYEGFVNLDPSQGYTFTFQRCCRNGTINNITDPGDQGSTFSVDVPNFNTFGCNSTPEFQNFPPIILCALFDFDVDMSATDADGDSLSYSLCAPFNYSSSTNSFPNPSNPPPYNLINFESPFTASLPIPSSPAISIDAVNGKLSGIPNALGQYLIGFCVEEYRNGVLLNTVRRDIQLNTANCTPVITSAVQDQEQFCDSLTVEFKNQTTANVNIQNYKWDFGVPGTLADTSRLFEPTFTYPDTGKYTITLIANPDLPCNDTSTEVFEVYQLLEPQIAFDGKACKSVNDFQFIASGTYEDYAKFEWKFGSAASTAQATTDTVNHIKFTGNGPFQVELIVSQDNCSDTVNQVVTLFDEPVANFIYNPSQGCYPLPVTFLDQSIFEGNATFSWDFGDGNQSTLQNPQNTYTSNDYFDVSLELITTDKCKDTVSFKIDSAIHTSLIYSNNQINFTVSDDSLCSPASISINDQSIYEGNAEYYWDFGDGTISTDRHPTHTFTDTGKYTLGLLLVTKDKCIDTLIDTTSFTFVSLPRPESVLLISDSALPLKEANFTFDASQSRDYLSSAFEVHNERFIGLDVLNYTFKDTGHFQISHIATNTFECKDTSQAEVFVYDEFEFIIPNIFTPNGDRINDEFAPLACGVYEYEVEIFNRYGTKVFSSNSLNISWDGRISGLKAHSGIYFYSIKIKDFRGEYRYYQGSLTLLDE